MSKSLAYFPIVGLIIGFIDYLFYLIFKNTLSKDSLSVILITIPIILTGAYHEDGIADVGDSYGGYTRERMFEIMKDSRIGTFGGLALICVVLLKYTFIKDISLDILGLSIILSMVVSRFCLLIPFKLHPYAGITKTTQNLLKFSNLTLLQAFLVTIVIVYFTFNLKGVVILLIVQTVSIIVSYYFRHKYGGLTGDMAGALEQINELSCFLIFMLLSLGTIHL